MAKCRGLGAGDRGHLTMNVGSIYSGIGGLDLGLQEAGYRIAFQCEADAFRRKILSRHWPGVQQFHDVGTLREESVPAVDLVVGEGPGPNPEWAVLWSEAIMVINPLHGLLICSPQIINSDLYTSSIAMLRDMGYGVSIKWLRYKTTLCGGNQDKEYHSLGRSQAMIVVSLAPDFTETVDSCGGLNIRPHKETDWTERCDVPQTPLFLYERVRGFPDQWTCQSGCTEHCDCERAQRMEALRESMAPPVGLALSYKLERSGVWPHVEEMVACG